MHFRQSSSLAPIRALPVELLSYIFVLGAHSPPDASNDDTEESEALRFDSESIKTPLIYSSVCRHWRNVALNTPALWTSICITIWPFESSSRTSDQKKGLDTSHITSYLSLSRKCPIDILLDARDVDWDFCEPEITSEYSYSSSSNYTPPFSNGDMRTVMSLLLPHLSRWRSIDILTDTWAPMHVALGMLNEPLMHFGAPQLESLTLMRCNEFISYAPQFQPSSLHSPELFSRRFSEQGPTFGAARDRVGDDTAFPQLPRLRKLALRGVHVDWTSLSKLLRSQSQVQSSRYAHGLRSLELSFHSLDVRPTQAQFRDTLSACPNLVTLVVNGSGFAADDAESEVSSKVVGGPTSPNSDDPLNPILLPHLKKLSIGYRTSTDGCGILSCIRAPGVLELLIQDATHPAGFEEVDAMGLLVLISGADARRPAPLPEPTPPSCSCVTSSNTEPSAGSSFIPPSSPSSMFPALQDLTLKGVRLGSRLRQTNSDLEHVLLLRQFLHSIPDLRSLELRSMEQLVVSDVLKALSPALPTPRFAISQYTIPQETGALVSMPSRRSLPSLPFLPPPTSMVSRTRSRSLHSVPSCPPCLHLEMLRILRGQSSIVRELKDLLKGRLESGNGACRMTADVYLSDTEDDLFPYEYESESSAGRAEDGDVMRVRIFKTISEDAAPSDAAAAAELDEAFQCGGVFNDPLFDARYSSVFFNY